MNFIVIEKETNYGVICKENTELERLIGASVSTIIRNKQKLCWDWGKYRVHNVQKYYKSNKRGGKRHNNMRFD
jgi:hypothetical protein